MPDDAQRAPASDRTAARLRRCMCVKAKDEHCSVAKNELNEWARRMLREMPPALSTDYQKRGIPVCT
jgi:hypothetical protein